MPGKLIHIITVLHVDGCAGGSKAIDVALSVAATHPDVLVQDILIDDEAIALDSGFRGSPTVLIDGLDIEACQTIPLGAMG